MWLSAGFFLPDYEGRYWISNEYRTRNWCGMHVSKDAAYKTSVHLVLPQNQPTALLKSLDHV